jgi:glycosyltransferase involved in cell wall biosynthesis
MPSISSLLCEALRAAGYTVDTERWGRGVQSETMVGKILRIPRDILRVHARLRAEPWDVLLVQTSLEWASLLRDIPLLAVARANVGSAVLQFHGGYAGRLVESGNSSFKLLSRAALRLAAGTLVLSSEEQRALQQFRPDASVCVVANPFVPHEPEPRPPSRHDRPVLLFAGRLIESKGIYDVLAAAALLQQSLPCRLVIAGEGPEAPSLRQRTRELGLDEDVELTGHLDADTLATAYAEADAFVFPTAFPEGFPTVLAEAMAAGLPIVTTAVRGAVDHLRDERNAIFVPAHDPCAIAAAVERLLTDSALREAMSYANREKVKDFAPAKIVEAYVAAITTIHGTDADRASSVMARSRVRRTADAATPRSDALTSSRRSSDSNRHVARSGRPENRR